MSLSSPLKKVKGLGSAKSGTHHWLMQRYTALALIPLVIWFVISVICAVQEDMSIIQMMHKPFSALAMILFLGVALYHGALGLKIVIEDYVHKSCTKHFLIIIINFFSFVTAAAAILAILNLQFSSQIGHKDLRKDKEHAYEKIEKNLKDGKILVNEIIK